MVYGSVCNNINIYGCFACLDINIESGVLINLKFYVNLWQFMTVVGPLWPLWIHAGSHNRVCTFIAYFLILPKIILLFALITSVRGNLCDISKCY